MTASRLTWTARAVVCFVPLVLVGALSCQPRAPEQTGSVVVYCSVDDVLAREVLDVFAATSGVRVRAAPTLDAAVLAAAQPGDPLDILENREEAVTKVGLEGEWIYVRTPGRVAGYVAAWYLQPYL